MKYYLYNSSWIFTRLIKPSAGDNVQLIKLTSREHDFFGHIGEHEDHHREVTLWDLVALPLINLPVEVLKEILQNDAKRI